MAFGYWCTDFLVVQRAMAAESMSAARRTPVIATIPKMLIPAIVIVPGMIALVATPHEDVFPHMPRRRRPAQVVTSKLPPPCVGPDSAQSRSERRRSSTASRQTVYRYKADNEGKVELDYDMAIPMMLVHYFPTGLLGLGLTALMASFMSGMAGNVTAFNTVWTYDIYQSYIAPNRSDNHYLWMGRMATVFGIVVSIAAAYVGRAIQQHHGFHPTGVRLRQRAAVRHVPAGHVLEAGDRARGVLRPAWRAPAPRPCTRP